MLLYLVTFIFIKNLEVEWYFKKLKEFDPPIIRPII